MFPMADDLARFWLNIRNRVDAITEIPPTHWRPEDYWHNDPKAADRTYARRGGFLTPVDFPLLDFGIAPHTVDATDTTQLLGLLVARDALNDAGYGPNREHARDRVSVILGVTGTLELVIPLGARLGHPIWRRALEAEGVDEATTENVVRRIADSYVGWQESSFPGLLGNVAAGRIANRLDLGGTNCVVDAACASSLGAVNLAMLELAAGRCDLAVSGGLDTFNDIFMYMCFSKTPALSPSGDARPFDASADGTTLGEGLGIMVLKRLADARRDGDRIYAVIRSMGTSSDGKGQAVYAPSAAGQVKALRQAYELAGVSPRSIELVEAHGTGTRVGDAIELEALEQVYRQAGAGGPWCALGSVKSQVGHTKAAAGAAGLIKAALALHHKVLPPTIKVEQPIESLASGTSPFYVNASSRPWLPGGGHPRRAAVSAFGFGGSNFHCLLEEAGPEPAAIDWGGDVQILAYSDADPVRLAERLPRWKDEPQWSTVRQEAAQSRGSFRAEHGFRVLVVCRRGGLKPARLMAAAAEKLEQVAHGRTRPATTGDLRGTGLDGAAARSVSMGSGPQRGALAMLFPGQGSQAVGMFCDLACRFPHMQDALALWNGLAGDGEPRLSDLIYPPSCFRDDDRRRQHEMLRDTRFAQPALGAVSVGLWRILEDFGVRPALVGGHSFGELTALHAAGRLDAEALARLSRRRGALMAGCAGDGDPGAMLAVLAPLEQVARLIEEYALDVVVANKNAPAQCVLAGPSAEMARAATLLGDAGVRTTPLAVSAAFHSRLVARAEAGLRDFLTSIEVKPGTLPVMSNSTAAPYPADPEAARDLLAGQLARPVEFVAQVEAMYQMGAHTFLEVGPGTRLTGLVRSILDGREHHAIAVQGSAGDGEDEDLIGLALALARLAALGFPVKLSRWDDALPAPASPPAARRKSLTVKVSGAHPTPSRTARTALATTATGPRGVPEVTAPSTGERPAAAARDRAPKILATAAQPQHADGHHHAGEPVSFERTMKPSELNMQSDGNGKPASGSTAARATAAAVPARATATAAHFEPMPASGQTALGLALRQTQDNLLALQRLAEQTAQLHRQFLEGQAATQQTFQSLLERQHRLTATMLGQSAAFPSSPPEPAAPAVLAGRDLAVAPPLKLTEAKDHRGALEAVNGRAHSQGAEAAMHGPASGPDRPAPHAQPHVVPALLEVVAEKTGYPVEMLELDMLLDDDLGIDSIKRVEILSAIQDRLPDAPLVGPEQLGTLRTLRQIAGFLDHPQPAHAATAAFTSATSSPSRNGDQHTMDHAAHCTAVLLEVVAEKTGYPAEMLELDMMLDDDLGIDSIKRVEILSAIQDRLPDAPLVGPEQLGTLRTLRQIAGFLDHPQPAHAATAAFTSATSSPSRNGDQHTMDHAAHCTAVLLEVVAEKTGYPAEMLELDMMLDDDLGIDSIKRVEILSAIQDRLPDAPLVGPEQLGTLRTLRQIAGFLDHPTGTPSVPAEEGRAAQAPEPAPAAAAPASAPAAGPVHATLECLVPHARPLADPHRRERLALPPGSLLWLVDDRSPLTPALVHRLTGLGHEVQVIDHDAATPAPADNLAGMILLAPPSAAGVDLVKHAFRLIRTAGPALRRQAERGGAVLMTVSRLDGLLGLNGLAGSINPVSGALAGLTKTASHEWPEVHCKAVDLDASFQSPEAADRLVTELFSGGPVEVGLTARSTYGVELVPHVRPQREETPPPGLREGDVVVISGGARGITAEAALELARSSRPRLVLLGRTPEPGEEPAWLAGLPSEAAIRRAILEHAEKPCPPQAVNEHLRLILSQREIRGNLKRIAEAGAEVSYHAVDVRDREAVHGLLAAVCRQAGPVRGLVHGAGVLADRRIEDLTDSQFAQVFDTKVDGLWSLMEAVDPQQLRFLAVFSSSTARFGRTGQAAYAAANEWLNKFAQKLARELSSCRVVAFNWGPWDGGMVTAALKPMFEREGLGLIPPGDGARLLVHEIQKGAELPVELVVLARAASEPDAASARTHGHGHSPTAAPALEPRPTTHLEPVFERRIDMDALPVLRDHVIDGHAVLPMALILEWLAETAAHRHPGLVVQSVENVKLHKGVVLRDQRAVTVSLRADKGQPRGNASILATVELRGMLGSGREITHARGSVMLAAQYPAGERLICETRLAPTATEHAEIYRRVLFHGPAMQAIQRIDGWNDGLIAGWAATSPPPAAWIERPLRRSWITDPLAIDAAFQLVVLWTREHLGSNSLPTAIGAYRQFRKAFPAQGVRVLASVRDHSRHRAVADIELVDAEGKLVARIEGYECVIDSALNHAFRRNRLSQLETASS